MLRGRDGICRLCGRLETLTFEHVPPRRAYNAYPAVYQTLEQWETGEGETYQPEGRGDHVLCQRCNNETGGNYGGAFVDWARQGMERVHQLPGKRSLNYHGQIFPLRVLKQIAVIFFDTAIEGGHAKHADLARFVFDRSSTQLPPSYRFFVFWYGGGSLRQTGIVGVAHLGGGGLSVLAEFVHPPFGYVLALSEPMFERSPTEITDFAGFGYDEAITLNRRFPVLETHWMMPGDYRTQEQIERDQLVNALEAGGIKNARQMVERIERAGG